MKKEGQKYRKAFPGMAVGVFTGLLVLMAARAEYYDIMQYQKNMHPSAGFYILPILFVVVMIFALPVEALFRRRHIPSSHFQAGLIGVGYATLLIWWAFPAYWTIFLFLNPLSVRGLLCIALGTKSRHPLRKTAIVLLFISIPLAGYGTHLQAVAPDFEAYQQHRINLVKAEDSDKDPSPGYGLGLAMASAWPFTVLMQGILVLVFLTSGSFVLSIMKRTKKADLLRTAFAVFTGVWAFGVFVFLRSAADDLRWGFTLLATARMITALGLMAGSIGLFREISCELLGKDAE